MTHKNDIVFYVSCVLSWYPVTRAYWLKTTRYLLVELPSNIVLKKVGANVSLYQMSRGFYAYKVSAAMDTLTSFVVGHCYYHDRIRTQILELSRSILKGCSGKVHNFQGLLSIRIFLGFCEGGLLPGIVSTINRFSSLRILKSSADLVPELYI